MADKKYTLLELHLGDGTIQIGPATLGGSDGGDDDIDLDFDFDDDISATEVDIDSDSEDDEDGGSCRACTAGKLLLVVGGLVALVVVASKLLGGDEGLDELEELEELADDEE